MNVKPHCEKCVYLGQEPAFRKHYFWCENTWWCRTENGRVDTEFPLERLDGCRCGECQNVVRMTLKAGVVLCKCFADEVLYDER